MFQKLYYEIIVGSLPSFWNIFDQSFILKPRRPVPVQIIFDVRIYKLVKITRKDKYKPKQASIECLFWVVKSGCFIWPKIIIQGTVQGNTNFWKMITSYCKHRYSTTYLCRTTQSIINTSRACLDWLFLAYLLAA